MSNQLNFILSFSGGTFPLNWNDLRVLEMLERTVETNGYDLPSQMTIIILASSSLVTLHSKEK